MTRQISLRNDDLLSVDRELRQAIAELELVSHAPTMSLDRTARDTSDEPGGRRPGQGDGEPEPRKRDVVEHAAWEDSYQRKTPAYFREERLEAIETEDLGRLIELRDDARLCLETWRRRPLVSGKAPAKADPEWKRYIAECDRPTSELVAEFGCTRQYINRLKAIDWSARDESEPERIDRQQQEWLRRRAA